VAHITPQVRDGVLVIGHGAQGRTIALGSAAWQGWLGDARTTTFRFVHQLATFTVRKEHGKRGGSYWYAYHRRDGRLHKGYLGRTENLTLQRLDEVATRLANGPSALPREQAAPHNDQHPPRLPAPAPDAGLPPDTLLATKLYPPSPRRDLVRRPRLTERLSSGVRGPLTLLVAPAGWGKTTLLADWRASDQEGAHASQRPLA
jgi:hypothetical protein